MANELIFRFYVAQENRVLSADELGLHRDTSKTYLLSRILLLLFLL
jgi:hypothetical protein